MCESNQPAVFRSEFRFGVFCPSQCGGSGVLPHAVAVLLLMSDQSVYSTGSVPIGATFTNLSASHNDVVLPKKSKVLNSDQPNTSSWRRNARGWKGALPALSSRSQKLGVCVEFFVLSSARLRRG